MSSSPTNVLELITSHYVRNNYEKEYNQNVPMALKYLILQFSNKVFSRKLLSNKQDLGLYKLISTKLSNIHRFNLLFRASDHEYSAAKFHEYCDNKGPTITIIQSNWGNIFGGYTSKSWKSDNSMIRDENAFLFLIKSDDISLESKCPLLLELQEFYVQWAIEGHSADGPVFGAHDIRIVDKCNKKIKKQNNEYNICEVSHSNQRAYIHPLVKNICGGNIKVDNVLNEYLFQVIDYEVFPII